MTAPRDLVTTRVLTDAVLRSSGPTTRGNIQFMAASPDPASYPAERLAEAIESVLASATSGASTAGSVFDYDVGPGFLPLREQLADRLQARARSAIASDDITITHGAAGAIEAVAAAFVQPGDSVFVEEFSYRHGMKSFRDRGGQIVPCPSGPEGLDLDALAQRVEHERRAGRRPKVVYFCANFSNPLGRTMPEANRQIVAELATRENLLVVQDDTYSQIFFGSREPTPMITYLPDRTIMVGSMSKVVAPTLRLGWTVSTPELAGALVGCRTDLGVGLLMQRTVAELLTGPWFDERLADLVKLYRLKRDIMRAAIASHCPSVMDVSNPDGGFALWLTMAEGSANALSSVAPKYGVSVLSQSHSSATSADGPSFRLGYSQVPIDDLEEGVRRVGRALADPAVTSSAGS
jgi:2-aminoadipate transaminase